MTRLLKFKQFSSGLVVGILLILSLPLSAQQKFTLSGSISDSTNGEELIGAIVAVTELKTGTVTNEYGFYSITLPEGEYAVKYSYLGFETMLKTVKLNASVKFDIELQPLSNQLNEVVVTAQNKDENIRSTQMSVNTLKMAEIEAIPVVFGERDVIKTMQLLPGIKSSENGGGFFVRGGGSDQNLILLDEAPVYNASHLLGFFSVFNSDAIKDLTVYKGHIPAEFGGRASSVLDIKMKDGNNKKLNVSGGIGLISSRLTVEAPIVKDQGSFIISGRRTYLDLFAKLSNNQNIKNSSLYFYDLNAKANYRLGKNDRLFISGYFGRDNLGYADAFGFDWGNATGTLRWNHVFSDRLFLNSTALISDYNYKVELAGDKGKNNGISIKSNISDESLKEDFTYFLSPDNTLKFGVSAIHHTFVPGQIIPDANANIDALLLQKKYAWETAVYVSEDLSISNSFKINAGLRYSWFAQIGPGNIFTYDKDGDVIDIKTYKANEIVKTYGGLEPRLGLTYILNERQSIKASVGRNQQFLHLISNSTSGTPIDLWIPSSNNVKPQIADQIALGYFQNFKENMFESSLEVYYKNMKNQVDYKTGADLVFNDNVESQLLYGEGHSYGTELYLKKNKGKLTGWISYTLSKTERVFDGIGNGKSYPATWDRTHDLSVVSMYKLNESWTFSASFAFRTGDARTFPIGKYEVNNETVNLYGRRNQNRMPDYHRLDLGATKFFKSKNNFESSLNFSIYNAYGQRNAFALQFEDDPNDPTKSIVNRISLFNFVPSITYNFKFK